MINNCKVNYRISSQNEAQDIADFLHSICDELYFSERKFAVEITSLLFTHGGVIVGTVNNEIVSVVGYFLGDPARHYANKEIGFIYVAGLAKPYRGTAAFRTGLRFLMETFKTLGLQEIRLHALEQDDRLNSLYSRFAGPIRKEVNRRGFPCVLYGNRVENVLTILDKREKRRHIYNITPMHRPSTSGTHRL